MKSLELLISGGFRFQENKWANAVLGWTSICVLQVDYFKKKDFIEKFYQILRENNGRIVLIPDILNMYFKKKNTFIQFIS